jgi:hypothetical protein
MSLDNAIQQALNSIPECVAGGYVDMSTGMLLGVKTVDSHPAEVLDLVAAATADLFQGPTVISIEKMFRKSRGQAESNSHYFQEIMVFSENLLHVFMRCKTYPRPRRRASSAARASISAWPSPKPAWPSAPSRSPFDSHTLY